MKKVISLILAVILLASISVVSTSSAVFAPIREYGYDFENSLYIGKFPYINISQYGLHYGRYAELYYHHVNDDPNAPIDWALADGYMSLEGFFVDEFDYLVIGDRVLIERSLMLPSMGYYVYDVAKDEFINIRDVNIDEYKGLLECLDTLNIGTLIGDADLDGKLSVMDATFIQQALASMIEFNEDDIVEDRVMVDSVNKEKVYFISDFDRDGERTVLDATAIQYKLAGLE